MKQLTIEGVVIDFYRGYKNRYSTENFEMHEFVLVDETVAKKPVTWITKEAACKAMDYINQHNKLVSRMLKKAKEVPDAPRVYGSPDTRCYEATYFGDVKTEQVFDAILEEEDRIDYI